MGINTIGQTIKFIREIRKISAASLAEIVGVSPAAVSKWETGVSVPRYDKVLDIAKALNVPDTLLLVFTPENYPLGLSEYELDLLCKDYQNAEILTDSSIYAFLFEQNPIMGDLFRAFCDLNDDGQKKAVERVEELTEILRYKAKEED